MVDATPVHAVASTICAKASGPLPGAVRCLSEFPPSPGVDRGARCTQIIGGGRTELVTPRWGSASPMVGENGCSATDVLRRAGEREPLERLAARGDVQLAQQALHVRAHRVF